MQAAERPRDDDATKRGRPRDPSLDGRIFDAAIGLYAEAGWTGFTFDAVARASGVGKGALYRRWAGRADLLSATLDARWEGVGEIDTGTLRGDLLALVRFMLGLLVHDHMGVIINMQVDARRFDEMRVIATPLRARQLDRLRRIVARGVERGELPAGTDTRLITDVLVGAVTNHVLATPVELHGALELRAEAFGIALVDLILNGTRRGGT